MRPPAIWQRRLSRRQLLAFGVGGATAGLLGWARAQEQAARVGVVLPTRTGLSPVISSRYQAPGEAARMGAISAEENLGLEFPHLRSRFEVLTATAPNGEAALRAARRLAASEEVFALIGGLGSEQALALNEVAGNHGILFLNIGCPSDTLREQECSRFTFHVEASASMYLDAIAEWATKSGLHRWFFVQPSSSEGDLLYRRALKAATRRQPNAVEVGRAVVAPEQPVIHETLRAIASSKPDVVLLLTEALAQLDFLGQATAAARDVALLGFPDPVSQTRVFYQASREVAPEPGAGVRLALWEATLEKHGARELNQGFFARWGLPMDPSAWATYQAVKILAEAVSVTGSLGAESLIAFLESGETEFDIQKGVSSGFSREDHQLLQPLYAVRIDPEAQRLLDLARVEAVLPGSTWPHSGESVPGGAAGNEPKVAHCG